MAINSTHPSSPAESLGVVSLPVEALMEALAMLSDRSVRCQVTACSTGASGFRPVTFARNSPVFPASSSVGPETVTLPISVSLPT